jgi:hypothetical protein
MRDVRRAARQQVVDANHRVAAIQQRLRQMRSNESRRAGYDDTHSTHNLQFTICNAQSAMQSAIRNLQCNLQSAAQSAIRNPQ